MQNINIKKMITKNTTEGLLSIAAAAAIHFVPDQLDHIVEGLLGILGLVEFSCHDDCNS